MKRKILKLVSVVLSLLLTMSSLSIMSYAVDTKAVDYKVGDIIEFGSYPQSEVTDARLKTELNKLEKTWVSYGYYSGDDRLGSAVQGDWMEYADVEYNGEKYRAVYFSSYRPSETSWSFSDYALYYQKENGYYTNRIYWFKYDPIKWRVIDPMSGLVLSELAIDSQPFQNTVYISNYGLSYSDPEFTKLVSDYSTSSIRIWLEGNFYNVAFTEKEKSNIIETVCEDIYSESSVNKLFLISAEEFNKYKLEGITCETTDYAKSQGIGIDENKYSWFIRTVDTDSWSGNFIRIIYGGKASEYYDGYEYALSYPADVTHTGIRPAMVLDSVKHKHSYTSKVTTEATCTKTGVKTFTCSCGDKYTETIPAVDHTYNKTTVAKSPTCVETGVKMFSCVCGDFYTEDIPVVDHKAGSWAITVNPTIDTEGKKVKKCTVCKMIMEEASVPKLSPADFIDVSVDDATINYKSTVSLNAEFGMLDGVNYNIEYSSSNPSVATVDKDGKVTATGTGEAVITVTVTDEYGNVVEDTCKVTVSYAWWQWLIIIFLFGWIWY